MRAVRWLLVGSVVLVGVMFVAGFPLHTYLQQRQNLAAVSAQSAALAKSNKSLSHEVQVLQTDSAVEQIARQDYHMVKPGEQAYAILPAPSPTPRSGAAPKPSNRSSDQTGRSTRRGGSGDAGGGTVAASGSNQASAPGGGQSLLSRVLGEFSF